MLILYKNITPNYSKTHYYFKDFNKYLTFLETNKVTEIDNKRYTLENGFIRIALDDKITDVNYNEITYIVDTHNNLCYHVNNIALRTTYVRYDVSVDLWGSYIYKAQLNNINVLKCNRKISDNGIYDEITHTKPFSVETLKSETFKWYDLYIGMVVNIKGDDYKYPVIYNMVTPLSRIREKDTTWFDQAVQRGWGGFLSLLTSWVNHIKITSTGKGFLFDVLQMYIIPSYAVDINANVKIYTDAWDKTEQGSAFCEWNAPQALKNVDIEKEIDPNKKYIIGGVNGTLPFLNKCNNKITPRFNFVFSSDSFKSFINNGDTIEEITKSFELPTSTNTEVNAINNIPNVLRVIFGATSTIIGGIKGSPLALTRGISTTSNAIANLVEANEQKQPNARIGNMGSVSATYGGDMNNQLCPFKLFSGISLINEQVKTRKTGVNFNEYINTLENVFNFDLLGTGEATDDTYLICITDIANIPTNAISEIENKLRTGIYLQYLS